MRYVCLKVINLNNDAALRFKLSLTPRPFSVSNIEQLGMGLEMRLGNLERLN